MRLFRPKDWRAKLRAGGLGEKELRAAVVDVVREKTGRDPESRFFLENLSRQLATTSDGDERLAMVERFALDIAMSAALPKLQVAELLPVLRPTNGEGLERFAQDPFCADLSVFYVQDLPHATVILPLEALDRVGGIETVRERAVMNLDRFNPQVETRGRTRELTGASVYNSSLLLRHGLFSELATGMVGPLVAAVPSRDTMMFVDGGSQTDCDEMVLAIHERFEMGDYSISRTMFEWTGSGWIVFDGGTKEPGIQNPTMIDLVATAPDGARVVMAVQARAWDDTDLQVAGLRAKIATYTSALTGPQLKQLFPVASGPIRIELMCGYPPAGRSKVVIEELAGRLWRDHKIRLTTVENAKLRA